MKNRDRTGKIIIVFVSLLMVVFWQVLASYFWGSRLISIDKWINEWVLTIRKPGLNEFMFFITLAGNSWTIIWVSLLIGGGLILSGRKKCFLALVLTNILGLLFVSLTKFSIGRIRPPLENALIRVDGFSLPSGHSYFGLVVYGLLTFFGIKHYSDPKKKLLLFLFGFGSIVLLAISRIYLGVHYLSDVLAGLATSGIWLGIVIFLLERKQIYFLEKKKIVEVNLKNFIWLFLLSWLVVLTIQFIAEKQI